MKSTVAMLGLALLIGGCGGGNSAPTAPVAVTPTPPPPPPTPILPPPPTPPVAPPMYSRFADVYIFRQGPSVLLPSGCASLSFQNQPPGFRSVTAFGQGLSFRHVITPQVWTIGGDGVTASFDGRSVDQANTTAEVAHLTAIDNIPVRFSITQPVAVGTGLDYARVASVTAPVGGITRQYQCLLGVPTLAADLATSPSGAFARAVVAGTAHVTDAGVTRAYSLERSVVTVSAEMILRQVIMTVRLIGTPVAGGGPDIDLGTYTASAPIDQATTNFGTALSSASRAVTGSFSGRFFGPQGLEIGSTIGGTVPVTNSAPGFVFNAALFGLR